MNREIIFKFWNKKRKNMVNGYHDITKGIPMIGDFIWLQYTELEDVNHNKVFDGDIIYNYDVNVYCEVKMIDGSWSVIYKKGTIQSKETIFTLYDTLSNLYWVVGNIYENPELI